MTRPINLAGFNATFLANEDPWATFSSRDEAYKRQWIVRFVGRGPAARLLELGSGNGSNSVALARRALRLDACEGTRAGVSLTQESLANRRNATAFQLILPARFPRRHYEAVVIAELLYYLSPIALRRLARDTARALRPGGRLVLAHHHMDFHDTSQTASDIHRRFLRASGRFWQGRQRHRNHRWLVEGLCLCR